MKKIRTIETPVLELKRLRVCAYCRVSSDQAEQQESFSAQVEHYTNHIKNNPAWNFDGIYADNAISGKNAAKRPEFMRMVKDAENQKFDLILTKSISRFARNTADCLETVRKLKQLGIAVQFEKEAINTLNVESELMLSILSSVAEEELVSISQNMHWSNQRRFKQGKFSVNTKRFLGYDKGSDGNLVIKDTSVREYIARRADLIGAIRLPNTAFKALAGTEVTADILFFQKLESQRTVDKYFLPDWVFVNSRKPDYMKMNQYFIDHTEMVLGEMQFSRNMYGREDSTACIAPEGQDLYAELDRAIGSLHAAFTAEADQSFEEIEEAGEENAGELDAPEGTKNYTYVVQDDKIYYYDSENVKAFAVEIEALQDKAVVGHVFELDYKTHIEDVRKNCLNAQSVDAVFKHPDSNNGYIRRFDIDEYNNNWYSIGQHYGEIEILRYEVGDEQRLQDVLFKARQIRIMNTTTGNLDEYIAAMVKERFHSYGYTRDDMVFTTPGDVFDALKHKVPVYLLSKDNIREPVTSTDEISYHIFHKGIFGMTPEDKRLLEYLLALPENRAELFNRTELNRIYTLAIAAGQSGELDKAGLETIETIVHKLDRVLPAPLDAAENVRELYEELEV